MLSTFGIGAGRAASVYDEQADMFVRNLGLSLPINSLLALSVTGMIYNHKPTNEILLWVAACLCLNFSRHLMAFWAPAKNLFSAKSVDELKVCVIGALASGLTWCVIPVYFIDYASDQASFVSIILCGLTAGAAIQGNGFAAPVIVMAVPILGAMTIKVFLLGSQSGYILSLDLMIYLAAIVRSSLANEQTFVAAVLVKTQAHDLAERLKVEHAVSQAAADRYFQLANHDSLTGVANRASFTRALQAWLDEAWASGSEFSLFLVDLDHFKSINDTFGHSAGDLVLSEVAKRLSGAAGAGDCVARLGGDEFAILVRGGNDGLESRADLILAATNGPLRLDGGTVTVGVSIGIATFPKDGADAGALMARADLALYAAKEVGRQCWRRFDRDMQAASEMTRDIESDLPGAIAGGSMDVWWQPQVDLSGRVTGVEGLLRWQHPIHGWIAPPAIVACALKTRTSEALTGFVLAKACSMIAELKRSGRANMVVAVNISPSEIVQYDLPALVRTSMEAVSVEASRLELEITEETVLSDEKSIDALREVARSGVRLAIDDFGTGCTSLAYLRRLRVDRIKIDRCFITGLSEREGDRILVQALLGLGRALGIDVVAEGVESHEDVVTLRLLGCRIAQGYYFGKAMPTAQLLEMLAADIRPAAEQAQLR